MFYFSDAEEFDFSITKQIGIGLSVVPKRLTKFTAKSRPSRSVCTSSTEMSVGIPGILKVWKEALSSWKMRWEFLKTMGVDGDVDVRGHFRS